MNERDKMDGKRKNEQDKVDVKRKNEQDKVDHGIRKNEQDKVDHGKRKNEQQDKVDGKRKNERDNVGVRRMNERDKVNDSKNTFIVGEITKDGTKMFTIINIKWLCGGDCFWPPYMSPDDVKESVVVYGIPDEKWKKVPFRGLYFFGLFDLARNKLRIVKETTDVTMQEELLGEGPPHSSDTMDIQYASSSKNEDAQGEILRLLKKQEAEISALKKEVNELKAVVSVKTNLMPLMTVVTTMPISSVEQMKNFNEMLSVKDIFVKVANVLQKTTKSTNANDVVDKLLEKAISKNVAKSYDWINKTGKKQSFLELKNFIKLLTVATQHHYKDLTETDVRGHIQTYLKKIGEEVK